VSNYYKMCQIFFSKIVVEAGDGFHCCVFIYLCRLLYDSLISPLQVSIDEWKRGVSQLDRDHAKGIIILLSFKTCSKQIWGYPSFMEFLYTLLLCFYVTLLCYFYIFYHIWRLISLFGFCCSCFLVVFSFLNNCFFVSYSL